ncbi:FtsQ-type POTRA domain-containing protein [Paenibacillus sp. F411]|nr:MULTISPECIES: FtsQ-type POTRA domain-containing protein [Paenibacillus]MBO2943201.1 FtsQ-type POTRA domain-containing protein [Paenibacillus sp. F411]
MQNNHIPALKEARPKAPKAAKKIILVLMLLFAALLAVLFFRSPLSKVSDISIQGNTFQPDKLLLEQAGLKEGIQFFGVDSDQVQQALEADGTIQAAKVDKRFPGVIEITVAEHPTVAFEIAEDGALQAILATGTSVPVSASGIAVEKPILTHWDPEDPLKAQLSEVLAKIPNSLTADISEITPSPTPSFPDRIKLYTRSKFEVITAVSLLGNKVEYLNQVIEMQQPGYITMLEADSYEPFQPEGEQDEAAEPTTQE